MWTTESRRKSLVGYEKAIGSFLMSHTEKKGINCKSIAVLSNHIHCLVRLNSTQSISDLVQIMKGSSSMWMNKYGRLQYKFKWEDEYFAFSLGYSQVEPFESYLAQQAHYHQSRTVAQEIEEINKKYQLKYK